MGVTSQVGPSAEATACQIPALVSKPTVMTAGALPFPGGGLWRPAVEAPRGCRVLWVPREPLKCNWALTVPEWRRIYFNGMMN